jgi:hypothetical protein
MGLAGAADISSLRSMLMTTIRPPIAIEPAM